jgi:alpha-mannosidase
MARTPFRIIDKLIVNPTGVLSYFMIQPERKTEQYLPPELSFLEIDNKNIVLSALKKSEIGDFLVVRLFNISSNSQEAILKFCDGLLIKKAEIVNLLEEKPINKIKAEIKSAKSNMLEIIFGAHVIANIKIELK